MTGLRNARIVGKTLFLAMSVRVSLGETGFESEDLAKITLPNAPKRHPIH